MSNANDVGNRVDHLTSFLLYSFISFPSCDLTAIPHGDVWGAKQYIVIHIVHSQFLLLLSAIKQKRIRLVSYAHPTSYRLWTTIAFFSWWVYSCSVFRLAFVVVLWSFLYNYNWGYNCVFPFWEVFSFFFTFALKIRIFFLSHNFS